METNYSTIILRYVHDVVTGEFANIRVMLQAPQTTVSGSAFHRVLRTAKRHLLKIDHLHFRALMRDLTNRFDELSTEVRDDLHVLPATALSEIV